MNLQGIKNAVTSRLGRQLLVTQKHSPKILFAAGVVGVAATVVLASRATLKLDKILEEAENSKLDAERARSLGRDDYTDMDFRKDVVLINTKLLIKLAKVYGPAVVMGLASIAALTGSHVVLNRRYAAVTAAYGALDQGFRRYREKVVEAFGVEKDAEFRYDLVDKEIVEEDETGQMINTIKALKNDANPDGLYSFLFDKTTSSNWNREWGYNQVFLQCQQNYMNDLLRSRGHVFLNEVLDALGLARTKAGAVTGWVLDCCEGGGDNCIDFGVFEGDQWKALQFVNGKERSIWLNFNVDGVIWDKI